MSSTTPARVLLALLLAATSGLACLGPTESGLRAYAAGDYEVAVERWLPEAEAGDARAQFVMGLVTERGEGVPLDPAAAARWYLLSAEQDFAPAQTNLGLLHFEGRGVERDAAEAARWFRRAADQGFAAARSNLGVLYLVGHGVERDTEAGRELLVLAADQGDEKARAILRRIPRRGDPNLVEFLSAAERARTDEPRELEVELATDLPAVGDASNEALSWLERAAREGSLDARLAIGLMLRYGVGSEANDDAAADWLALAADQGSPAARCELGLMHLAGEGVPQDDGEAARLLEQAAAAGNAVAQHDLALLYARGRGVPRDLQTARAWMQRAAEGGSAAAHLRLGILSDRDSITEGDPATAYQHFLIAEALGQNGAAAHRERLASRLLRGQELEARARAERWLAEHARR